MTKDFYNANYLEAALAVKDVVDAYLRGPARDLLGVWGTRQALDEVSERVTRHTWEECRWGQKHFRLQAEMVGKTFNIVFVPLSYEGEQMQEALAKHQRRT